MKLTELKKIIKEEIAKILSENETKEKEKVETDTDTKTKPRRTITPAEPKTAPAKATTKEKNEEIAKKIADRFKKGKK